MSVPRSLSETIALYFRGERNEMFAIIICASIVMALVICLKIYNNDSFSKSLLITTVVIAALLGSTAVSLLIRDSKYEPSLLQSIQDGRSSEVILSEISRIETIISKYPIYRNVAIALAIAGLTAVFFSRSGIIAGVAVGLCLLFVAQISIDHYSEARARDYHEALIGRK